MAYDLKGKILFITGGATGIGFSCAKELLRNGLQAVTIADINIAKGEQAVKNLTQEFGSNRAIFVKTDVTKSDDLEGAFKTAINTWKTIDIVINNAGMMNDGQWQEEISLNCNAMVHGTLLGLQHMGKDKGGKGGIIVNTASTFGVQPGHFTPVYAATKHFVLGFSRSLGNSYHYDRTGVKILSICPGGTQTELLADADQCAMFKEIGRDFVAALEQEYIQSVENVGRGMVTLITKGENGSVWVVEADQPIYEIKIPDRRSLRK